MPLNIVANQGAAPSPQIVAPQTVIQRAQQGGNPNAALGLAYTDPIIRIDQTGLSFRQRQGPAGPEFQFDTGTLTLTLRQEMLISNTLSNCAQQKWIVHENGHVRDNQRIMTQMDATIRSDPHCRAFSLTRNGRSAAGFRRPNKQFSMRSPPFFDG